MIFASFAPVLKEIIDYQKKFASYRQKDGQKLYDVMLDSFEPGFTMEKLDEIFQHVKRAYRAAVKAGDGKPRLYSG